MFLLPNAPSLSKVSESEVAQSCPTLCDPWTIAHQAPPSMGFSRQDYWRGLPYPPSGNLPNPGIKPRSPELQMDSLPLSQQGSLSGTRVLCYCSFVDGGLINLLTSFWPELRMAHRNRCPQRTHWRGSGKL